MFLKSIKAQGFKSFADKLDLEINPGITGIVDLMEVAKVILLMPFVGFRGTIS